MELSHIKSLEIQTQRVIKENLYMSLATVTLAGNPWNTPLVFCYDDNLQIYWISWHRNQHSVNIRDDSRAFVTIFDSNVSFNEGLGVYIKGKAQELKNSKEILKGLLFLYKRRGKKPRDVKEFLSKFPRRAYRFTPEKVWVNGIGDIDGNYVDVRREVDVEKVKRLLGKSLQ